MWMLRQISQLRTASLGAIMDYSALKQRVAPKREAVGATWILTGLCRLLANIRTYHCQCPIQSFCAVTVFSAQGCSHAAELAILCGLVELRTLSLQWCWRAAAKSAGGGCWRS